ncbi:hypothetical protein C7T94_02615 [Pedobacter yulinensis]|uniref:Uncharacterized protein n=1 Tax=Pedobacter yulinensis TaxID=2126353 RepID=A0A2T3HRL5_9SPHI|nr:hypothetical protein C7T94_02615 [Pedobacter yulinensis]
MKKAILFLGLVFFAAVSQAQTSPAKSKEPAKKPVQAGVKDDLAAKKSCCMKKPARFSSAKPQPKKETKS